MISQVGELEKALQKLTIPVLDQYPRPWMTNLQDPMGADVFVVGANQATPHKVDEVGPHERFINAMLNRSGQTCRDLYTEVRRSPSGTRGHSDRFVDMLKEEGITAIVETNSVCFATEKEFKRVRRAENAEGLRVGKKLFDEILRIIQPCLLIVHGKGTVDSLRKDHRIPAPNPPSRPTDFPQAQVGGTKIFVIPSLGKPKVDKWPFPREPYLKEIARRASAYVKTHGKHL
jgi:hypothetical protein